MESLGVDELYIDRMSGKNTDRPELKKMMEFVRWGDTVIVESSSRFARNTKDLLELVEQLSAKGVELISQKESINTTTPAGKFMLTIFAAVAELERDYLLQRQREGITAAKAEGKYTGRKPKRSANSASVIGQQEKRLITATLSIKMLGVSKSTFYRLVREAR